VQNIFILLKKDADYIHDPCFGLTTDMPLWTLSIFGNRLQKTRLLPLLLVSSPAPARNEAPEGNRKKGDEEDPMCKLTLIYLL
jgi:hypothetical protein